MARNTSAVLDVVVENKDISSILKENSDIEPTSLFSDSTYDNSLVRHESLQYSDWNLSSISYSQIL